MPTINQIQINEISTLVAAGNRTGAYLKYFEYTGSSEALLQANISSFSGFYGETAQIANREIQLDYPSQYNIDVEDFSIAVASDWVNALQTKYNNTGNGYLTDYEMLSSARNTWDNMDMGDLFPGNIKLGNIGAEGTWYSIKAAFLSFFLESDGKPIKPADLELNNIVFQSKYKVESVEYNGEKIYYAVDTSNSDKVVHIFGNSQVAGESLRYYQAINTLLMGDVGGYAYIPARESTSPASSMFDSISYFLYGEEPSGNFINRGQLLQKVIDPITGKAVLKEVPYPTWDPEADNPSDQEYFYTNNGKGNGEIYLEDGTSGQTVSQQGSKLKDIVDNMEANGFYNSNITKMYVNGTDSFGVCVGDINDILTNLGGSTLNSSTANILTTGSGSVISIFEDAADSIIGGVSYAVGKIGKSLSDAAEAIAEFISFRTEEGTSWWTDSNGASLTFANWLAANIDDITSGDMEADEAFISFAQYAAVTEGLNTLAASINSVTGAKDALAEVFHSAFGLSIGSETAAANVYAGAIYDSLSAMAAEFILSSDGWDGEQYTNAGISILSGAVTRAYLQTAYPEMSAGTQGAIAVAVMTAMRGLLDSDDYGQTEWIMLGVNVGVAVGAYLGGQAAGAAIASALNLASAAAGPIGIVAGAVISLLAAKVIQNIYQGQVFHEGEFGSPDLVLNSIYQVQQIEVGGNMVNALVAVHPQGSTIIASGTGIGYVLGGSGADVLVGDANNMDTITGNAGADYLEGRGGDDALLGGDGNDHLNGGDGDDILQGDAGDDLIFGEDGDDIMLGGDGDDFMHGGSGVDTISGGVGKDYILAGGDDDAIAGDAGDDTIDGGYGDDAISGGDGNDLILGNLGNDTINGDDGEDTIFGDEGNDRIFGGMGSDFIDGGTGSDILQGDNGDDIITGGDGADFAEGGLGADSILGGDGDDTLLGGMDDDYIAGEDGNDIIEGGFGNDILVGGVGENTLSGGEGNDVFVISDDVDEENNIISDEAGTDTIYLGWLTQANATADLELLKDGDDLKVSYDGRVLATITGHFIAGGEIENIELQGGKYIDLSAVTYNGTTGIGSFSVGTLSSGSVAAEVADRADAVDENLLTQQLFWNGTFLENLSQIAYDEKLNDNIESYYNGTEVESFFRNRSKFGGKYTVYKLSTPGNMDGNEETYTFEEFEAGVDDPEDFYNIYPDAEVITTTTTYTAFYQYQNIYTDVWVNNQPVFTYVKSYIWNGASYQLLSEQKVDSDQDQSVPYNPDPYTTGYLSWDAADRKANYAVPSPWTSIVFDKDESIDFGIKKTGDDMLVGGYWDEVITGKSGDDVLIGNSGNDTLHGDAGEDWLFGGEGNDTLNGGADNDVLFGADGNDTMNGGDGDDALIAGDGSDTVNAGDGNDWVDGGEGNDTLNGDGGNDIISGGEGNDIINGGAGADILHGDDGDDVINGGDGDDIIYGGIGSDLIDGGAGNDIIHGGTGGTINGGDGEDRVSFRTATSGMTIDVATVLGSEAIISVEGVDGTDYNDTINGYTSTANLLYGNGGNDVIDGGSAADRLYGNSGNDTLNGGDGNDILDGGSGADTLNGGNGTDRVAYLTATTAVAINLATNSHTGDASGDTFNSIEEIEGSNFNDTFTGNSSANKFYGGNGDDSFTGGGGADTFDGGSGWDKVDYSTAGAAVTINMATNSNSGSDAAGDTFSNVEEVIGSGYNDFITGDSQNNTLSGGNGGDTIYGGSGDDYIEGGNGNDTLYGEDGNDTIICGFDSWGNTVYGGGGNDIVYFDSSENVYSGDGDDTMIFSGWNWFNHIDGGNGIDTLDLSYYTSGSGGIDLNTSYVINVENVITGSTNDYLNGNSSDNTFTPGTGNDTIYGNGGSDTANYRDSAISSIFLIFYSGSANGSIYKAAGGYNSHTLSSIENIIGSDGNDQIVYYYGSDANIIWGNGGNDIIYTGDGNDIIYGGAGGDNINGEGGNDTVGYIDSTASVTINLSNNTASGGYAQGDIISNFENIIGSNYNDTLTGNSEVNHISGAEGNDTLYGLNGDDTLYGGDGNDNLYGGAGADTLDGGAGDDRAYYNTASSAVTINLLTGVHTGDAAGDTYISIERFYLSNYGDTMQGSNGADNITGNQGNDILYGNDGNDILYGNDGTDSLYGGDGNDTLYGGAGADTLDGGAGTDKAYYTTSISGITFNAQTGVHTGDATGDTFNSIERFYFTNYDDTITGSNIADYFYGQNGNDTINGNQGNDTLLGDGGNDIINAGDGNDAIYGGAGADTITGGAGNDTFFFTQYTDSSTTGRDIITDFVDGADKIRFSSALANVFDDVSDFSITNSGGNTIVTDLASTFSFELVGTIALDNSDFLFS